MENKKQNLKFLKDSMYFQPNFSMVVDSMPDYSIFTVDNDSK
jgi:hypothetical protein